MRAIASAQLSKALKRATFHTNLSTHNQSEAATAMDVTDKAGPTIKRHPYRNLTDEGSRQAVVSSKKRRNKIQLKSFNTSLCSVSKVGRV